MYFISFCSIFTRLSFYIFSERKKESKHARQVLAELEEQFNGSFDPPTRKKIINWHSVYNPLIIDAFCGLHGRISSRQERKNRVYFFVCSSLLDNFFDRKELSNEQVDEICFRTAGYHAKTFDEKVFIHCNNYLLDQTAGKAGYLDVLKAEVKAQEASLQQFQKEISAADIEAIMKAKGGNAVLLCRYYLDLPASETEDRCWYQLGVLIQLSNDLYDIHKDMHDGIETLGTRCTNAFEMEQYGEEQIGSLKQLISKLPCSKAGKLRFSIAMAGLYALTAVYINRLKQLQGNAGRLPDFRSLERKQLVVDMEKPGNIFRWLKYVYRYGRM
jgi:hypothetical protein